MFYDLSDAHRPLEKGLVGGGKKRRERSNNGWGRAVCHRTDRTDIIGDSLSFSLCPDCLSCYSSLPISHIYLSE